MGDRHYAIQCRVRETAFADDGLRLDCPRSHEPGLLGAPYQTKTFEPDAAANGIYRYHRWLPIVQQLRLRARVDGLGTIILSAVEAIGRLPHYYRQAYSNWARSTGCSPITCSPGGALRCSNVTWSPRGARGCLSAWAMA